MKIRNGQGSNMIAVSNENRLKVYRYFQDNPMALQKDAIEDLGIGPITIRKHIRAIEAGWTPDL